MWPRWGMYKENRKGPNMLPWVTSWSISNVIQNLHFSSLLIEMSGTIVSNAKCKRMRTATLLESTDIHHFPLRVNCYIFVNPLKRLIKCHHQDSSISSSCTLCLVLIIECWNKMVNIIPAYQHVKHGMVICANTASHGS